VVNPNFIAELEIPTSGLSTTLVAKNAPNSAQGDSVFYLTNFRLGILARFDGRICLWKELVRSNEMIQRAASPLDHFISNTPGASFPQTLGQKTVLPIWEPMSMASIPYSLRSVCERLP
jgi:hypothetical protein